MGASTVIYEKRVEVRRDWPLLSAVDAHKVTRQIQFEGALNTAS